MYRHTDYSQVGLTSKLIALGILEAGPTLVDVQYWAVRVGVPLATVVDSLEELVAQGDLRRSNVWACTACAQHVSLEDLACAACGEPRDDPFTPLVEYHWARAHVTRDPAAVFLIHGMNSFGPWQEGLSWRFALLYGHSIPVFSFKYGRSVFSPLSAWLQRRRVRQLGTALRRASKDLRDNKRRGHPDVIAHSFGTLLFAELLRDAEFRDLAFGRVILTGSIVASDYRWDEAIAVGRVEATLNHRASADIWVPCARWFFPRSGRSGIDGFRPTSGLLEIESRGLGHTDYFAERWFDREVRSNWSAFLEDKTLALSPASSCATTVHGTPLRLVAGRAALSLLALAVVILLLHLLIVLGQFSHALLSFIARVI